MCKLEMRWTIKGEYIHVQAEGVGGNRSYGLAFDVKATDFYPLTVGSFEKYVRNDTVSLAGTGKPYTKGWLGFVKTSDEPVDLSSLRELLQLAPVAYWDCGLRKLSGPGYSDDVVSFFCVNAMGLSYEPNQAEPEQEEPVQEETEQEKEKELTMKQKKMRWVINTNSLTGEKTIHIQMKGEGGNREYGMAFDLPINAFPGVPASFVESRVADNTNSLASARAYTKGLIRTVPWESRPTLLRINLNPALDNAQAGYTDFLWLTDELDDTQVCKDAVAFVQTNGKEIN